MTPACGLLPTGDGTLPTKLAPVPRRALATRGTFTIAASVAAGPLLPFASGALLAALVAAGVAALVLPLLAVIASVAQLGASLCGVL